MRTSVAQAFGRAMVAVVVGWSVCQPVARSAQNENGPWQQIHRHTVRSFVILSYHLKKSDRPHMNGGDASAYGAATVLHRILNKNTVDTIGVILNDAGEVFTFESDPVYREVVDRITVKGPDGTIVPARAGRMLIAAPGRIVQIEGGLPAGWRPLQFADQGDVSMDTRLYAAAMRADERYHLYIKPCDYGFAWEDGAECTPCLQVPGIYCVAVLCNAEGRPVGVTCRDRIDLGPGGPAWRGREILADAGLSEQQQIELERKLQEEFAKNLYEIRILPRPQPRDEEEFDFGGRFPYRGGEFGRTTSREKLVYGLGLAGNKLLIPEALPKEAAAAIDTITVMVDGEETPARFGGVLTSCAATVVELEQGKLPHTAAFQADGKPARVEPFWAVSARELAGMDVRIECSRWIDKQQGYEDKWYPVMERSVPSGSWLLDRQGRLVGFAGAARREQDRLEPYLLGMDQDRYRSYESSYMTMARRGPVAGWAPRSRSSMRLFEAAEMAGLLHDAQANYDPHIRHLDKDEQKRRVWLGVEYTAPDKEMVKHLGLRRPTRDGRIGLVVNRIYAGSPAAGLGLTEGDVLLSLAVPETPWPIELTAVEREDFPVPDFEEADIPKEFEAMGFQMPRRRPWPNRENYLTRMLADIGAGTSVKLCYIHDGQTKEQEFTIEQSPPDMLSAAKYKNEKIGLTVKDLTYEVRAGLRLAEDDSAVVVTQVEQGTPAALARINMYELIRAIDGERVDGVGTFEKLIAAAQQQNKQSVRLTIEWMGKTRLADLKFDAAAPSGLLKSLLEGRQ